jgi:hypothetical protein
MLCVTIDNNYKRLFCNGYLPPTERYKRYKKYRTPHILLVSWYIDWFNDICKLFFLRLLMILFIRYQIMLQCWEQNPTDRPTFVKLKETMKEMERNHKVFLTCHISSVTRIWMSVLYLLCVAVIQFQQTVVLGKKWMSFTWGVDNIIIIEQWLLHCYFKVLWPFGSM